MTAHLRSDARTSKQRARADAVGREPTLDGLIVGGGPAGLTAALCLARFERRTLVVDAGEPRASWIPTSHNIPVFVEGISGRDLLARQREHVERYGVPVLPGTVTEIGKGPDGFVTRIDADGGTRTVRARRVLLVTGAIDVEPELPDLPDAVQRGLVRYAAGRVVRGLDQIVVAVGHAAVTATDIHNRCELPTEDEPGGSAHRTHRV